MNTTELTLLEGAVPDVLQSEIDASANFVFRTPAMPGALEARYVRRSEDYYVVYLSTQTGCAQACRFCHLTQQGQTIAVDASISDLLKQAETVCRYYEVTSGNASIVHFNFMARGEPLASRTILTQGDEVCLQLNRLARSKHLIPRVKVSTIMPRTLEGVELIDIFPTTQPDFYYSIYSVSEQFRGRWLPRALPVAAALEKLVKYQRCSRKIPIMHFALIEGQNDSESDIRALCATIGESHLRCDFNLVRYNPATVSLGTASSEAVAARTADIIKRELSGSNVKIVKPVGFDVKASCGMFVKRLPDA